MSVPQTSLNVYQARALATRKRRQAKGLYETPAQKAAMQMLIGGGAMLLDAEQCRQLATHPYLTHFQRAKFAALAEVR